MQKTLSQSKENFDTACLAKQVLELVGTTTLEDSLLCANANGIVCMTGMVGNKWALDNFSPMESIPEAVYLTKYSGEYQLLSQTLAVICQQDICWLTLLQKSPLLFVA